MRTRWLPLAALAAAPACGPTMPSGLSCPPCPSAAVCVADPSYSCEPGHGWACPGVCATIPCGGFERWKCPAGQTCVDDPRDDCNPAAGDADCPGFCAPNR